MVKRIASIALSLILMGVFYVYAVLREDENTKQTEKWVVADEAVPPAPIGLVESTQAKQLALAMGTAVPLPAALSSGSVQDSSYHGYAVRMLEASAPGISIRGVRPSSAAPMVRGGGITYEPSGSALLGYPLIIGRDADSFYYFLVTEEAAYEIRTMPADEQISLALLSTLQMVK